MFVVTASWILVILVCATLALSQEVRVERRGVSMTIASIQMRALAKSGVAAAQSILDATAANELDAPSEGWDRNADFASAQVGDGAFAVGYSGEGFRENVYGVQDEDRRIPLHLFDRAMLSRIPNAPVAAFDSLLAARARIEPVLGAIEQLQIDDSGRAFLDRCVTPFHTSGVNVNTAPPEVLLALGVPQSAVSKIVRTRNGTDMVLGTPDDHPFASVLDASRGPQSCGLSAEEVEVVSDLARRGVLKVRSEYFRVQARGWVVGRPSFYEIQAELRRPESGPCVVIDWREKPESVF